MFTTTQLRHLHTTRKRGAVIRSLAERIGLVSFGSVDPRSDDHDSIRGITASVKHRDRHFAVGAYDGYDIRIADRTYQPLHSAVKHTWCVIQVTLRSAIDVPYMLITPAIHEKDFEGVIALQRHLVRVPNDMFPAEFSTRYAVHMPAFDMPALSTLLPPKVALASAVRLWPHAVEIHRNTLYLYITEHRLDQTVLGGAIESALWLADTFDAKR